MNPKKFVSFKSTQCFAVTRLKNENVQMELPVVQPQELNLTTIYYSRRAETVR